MFWRIAKSRAHTFENDWHHHETSFSRDYEYNKQILLFIPGPTNSTSLIWSHYSGPTCQRSELPQRQIAPTVHPITRTVGSLTGGRPIVGPHTTLIPPVYNLNVWLQNSLSYRVSRARKSADSSALLELDWDEALRSVDQSVRPFHLIYSVIQNAVGFRERRKGARIRSVCSRSSENSLISPLSVVDPRVFVRVRDRFLVFWINKSWQEKQVRFFFFFLNHVFLFRM